MKLMDAIQDRFYILLEKRPSGVAVGNKAVRHDKWKLVGRDDPTDLSNWKLYDLEADRTELKDMAEKYPERLKQMAQAWCDWAKRTNW